ncbi:MAG: nickel insertion protein, partial [Candidatus Hydrothermarchaeaceae archaeon]
MNFYIDPSVSGISGNMMLGALVDLGADYRKLADLARVISEKSGCKIEVKKKTVKKNGVFALFIDTAVKGKNLHTGEEFSKLADAVKKKLDLSEPAFEFASNATKTLLLAEAKCHGKKWGDVE